MVLLADAQAIFVARCDHPLYAGLQLVIWRLPGEDRWSHDALLLHQEVGQVHDTTPAVRLVNLQRALSLSAW
jgi:hypothetical protein